MAAYATVQDVRDRVDERTLESLTDDAGSGQVDDAVVQKALEDASGEIDGYLGARYALPLAPVPAIILAQCVALAVHQLYGRRRDVPDHVESRRREAIRFLEQVAKGGITLGATDPNAGPDAQGASRLHMDNPPRVFTSNSMGGF